MRSTSLMDISEVLMVEINLQLDKLFFPFL